MCSEGFWISQGRIPQCRSEGHQKQHPQHGVEGKAPHRAKAFVAMRRSEDRSQSATIPGSVDSPEGCPSGQSGFLAGQRFSSPIVLSQTGKMKSAPPEPANRCFNPAHSRTAILCNSHPRSPVPAEILWAISLFFSVQRLHGFRQVVTQLLLQQKR